MDISELTRRQARLLYTYAYNDGRPGPWLLGFLFGSTAKSEIEEDIRVLNEGGWIGGFGVVRPDCYLKVVEHLLRSDRPFYAKLQRSNQFLYNSQEFLWNLCCLLSEKDYLRIRSIKRPDDLSINLADYFGHLAMTEEGDCLKDILSDKEKNAVITSALRDALMSDSLTEAFFSTIRRFTSTMKVSDDVWDMIGFYHWVSRGEWMPDHWLSPRPTRWSLGKKAIDELYHGNIADALILFQNALKINRQITDDRACFDDPVLCWFHTVCLCRGGRLNGGVSDARKLLSESSRLKFGSDLAASRILNQFLDDDYAGESTVVSDEVSTLLSKNGCALHESLGYLLLRFFKCREAKTVTDAFDLGRKPSARLLQHEMSAYLPLGKDEKDNLNQLFGGYPSLNGIHRKEPWELFFEGLGSTIAKESRQDRRVAYFFNGLSLSAIVEQTLSERGEWKDTKPLSRRDFMGRGFEFMNESDWKISAELRSDGRSENEAALVFPYLIGSDRIFTGNYYDRARTPAKITLDTASLAFTARGTKIEVSSNVTLGHDGKVPKCVVTRKDSRTYRCILVDDRQRNILQKFLGLGELPVMAAKSIVENMEQLETFLDVECDLATAAQMPAVAGSSQLAVRVTPEDTDYRVCVQASPLAGGTQRFSPGEGEVEIYDTAEGVTSRVGRNLLEEYANYESLRDFIKDSTTLDFETYQEVVLGSSESLLKLLEFTHENPDRYFMEWPQGQLLKLRGMSKGSIDIQVKTNVRWFEIEGRVDIGGEQKSLADLMTMYHNSDIEGYIKIGDREYLRMSETLRRRLDELQQLGKPVRGKIKVPVFQVGSVARFINSASDIHAVADGEFNDTLRRMEDAYASTPAVPSELNAELRDYQREGFEWMARLGSWGAGACLADDMGLGKTLQSLADLLYFSSEGPSLVVAPLSVVPNWVRESARFTPTLRMTVLNDQSDRGTCLGGLGPGDVVLTTYGVLVTESERLSRVDWNVVCLDEAHQIKNRNTRASVSAMGLSARRRVILTGTPVQNHLGELWNLFQFVNPGLLGTWTDFNNHFIREELTAASREKLQRMTQPFILRRTKMEVLSDLPEKNTYEHPVELTHAEMQMYEDMRRKVEIKFKKRKTKEEKELAKTLNIDFLAELTKLRLAANDMRLADDSWTEESSKILALKDIMSTLTDNPDNRILVFSQFTSFLELIGQALRNEGIDYLYLDGQTSMKERALLVTKFQTGQCPVFLISLKAGGLGLNLTAANYVIMMDPWWNPAIEQQASDRAHRIGQERIVTVIRMVAKHTIEEKILRLHETKQDLSDTVLEGAGESSRLTYDDMMEMISTI